WHGAIRRRVVAELPRVVVAPALDGAARRERAGRVVADRYGRLAVRETGDRNRDCAIGHRSASELADVVAAPALDTTGRSDGAGETVVCRASHRHGGHRAREAR